MIHRSQIVSPAPAGVQAIRNYLENQVSGFRRNDGQALLSSLDRFIALKASHQSEKGVSIMSMPIERLHDLFDHSPEADLLEFSGACQDCGTPVTVTVRLAEGGFDIGGGALYEPRPEQYFHKCEACFGRNPHLTHFQECEVYSRVVGYLRPVAQWNDGKQAEFLQRRTFDRALA